MICAYSSIFIIDEDSAASLIKYLLPSISSNLSSLSTCVFSVIGDASLFDKISFEILSKIIPCMCSKK